MGPLTPSGTHPFDLKLTNKVPTFRASAELFIKLGMNVNGLNIPQKRSMAFSDYVKQKIDILLLQETHLSKTSAPKYLSKHYPQVYLASSTTKTKGVAILIAKQQNYQEGRVIIDRSRGVLEAKTPNTQDQDSKYLARYLTTQKIVNIWREKHPIDMDYSYYSSVHASYSRIDFIFTKSTFVDYVYATTIHIIKWPDHGMKPLVLRHGCWRLNESLLLDKDTCTEISTTLREHFYMNTLADTSVAIRWDAHKAVIRGIFIKLYHLATTRKQNPTTYKEIQDTRAQLIQDKAAYSMRKTKHLYYE
ncbi:hypothetical protein XELAEV_18016954mg [Xenopus laevis]|uniref:Endonuclease/exonuclease/phosphatase domain-containing protein n=1 Tax=Xenopus laevis TaxID=8355 RepID=A0A974DCB9_XENLA|nr:hypothetical protein XELAEV_18016954mg [Xenopus laevis]